MLRRLVQGFLVGFGVAAFGLPGLVGGAIIAAVLEK